MQKDKENIENKVEEENSAIYAQEDVALVGAAKSASSKAIRSSRAMGITITVIKDNKIISIGPDQREEVIGSIAKSEIDISSLKKGMLLKRK